MEIEQKPGAADSKRPSLVERLFRQGYDAAYSLYGKPVDAWAANALAAAAGDRTQAMERLARQVRWGAGSVSAVASLGGLATVAVALGAEAVGVAVLQMRLLQGVAWLQGYRNLQSEEVRRRVRMAYLGLQATNQVKSLGVKAARGALVRAAGRQAARQGARRLSWLVRAVPLVGALAAFGLTWVETNLVLRQSLKYFPLREGHAGVPA